MKVETTPLECQTRDFDLKLYDSPGISVTETAELDTRCLHDDLIRVNYLVIACPSLGRAARTVLSLFSKVYPQFFEQNRVIFLFTKALDLLKRHDQSYVPSVDFIRNQLRDMCTQAGIASSLAITVHSEYSWQAVDSVNHFLECLAPRLVPEAIQTRVANLSDIAPASVEVAAEQITIPVVVLATAAGVGGVSTALIIKSHLAAAIASSVFCSLV